MDPQSSHQMQAKIAQIAAHYLARLPKEVELLAELMARARKNGQFDEIELIAHRIHGNGAMHRLEDVSRCAAVLEQLASSAKGGAPVDFTQLETALVHLTQAARDVIAQVGSRLNAVRGMTKTVIALGWYQ
jgi:HPt (histidine-containing phosphotransfer) domain-containing protein